ncbi:MAG: HAMP domain-containing sensor histidine kinase [Tissierellia bacterium]|nr:HAMP domain-containing sensor histidine kinase [Tissierellia bacterium]
MAYRPRRITLKNSLGTRLVISFLLIIFITVAILDTIIILGYRHYTYQNISNNLTIKQENSVAYFQKNYSSYPLTELVLEDTELNTSRIDAQVQIIDPQGYVLMDSAGVLNDNVIAYNDVQSAIKGEKGLRIGKVEYSDDLVMSVSSPLYNTEKDIVGILRYTTSLAEANRFIIKMAFIVIWIGVLVLLISTMFSFLLARSIIRPIQELTAVAKKMTDGQYKIRSHIDRSDELGKLSDTLNTLAEEIIKKDQIKNDFISSISHELRTPLTSIKGWASIIKSLGEGEEHLLEDGLNIIENESDRLSKMVEELLDFSRYISGRITLDKDIFNITTTCRDVSRQLTPKVKSADLDFIVDLEEKDIILVGDENRIKQLLINLLDNAIKFTEKGGWIKLTGYEEKDNYYILVSDNGVGIGKDDLIHVKEKFYKGKHSKSHSGIGLSISDEIVKLHNGSLEIFSEENIGTTIKITIPLKKPEEVE